MYYLDKNKIIPAVSPQTTGGQRREPAPLAARRRDFSGSCRATFINEALK